MPIRRREPIITRPKEMDSKEARKAFDDVINAICDACNAAKLTEAQVLCIGFGEDNIKAAYKEVMDKKWRETARQKYRRSGTHNDGDINFDVEPTVSEADDGSGVYVQAWVYVSKEDVNG